MLIMWIRKSLTTDAKHKLKFYNNYYAYTVQDDGDKMFFFIVKMVHPDTSEVLSDIKENMDSIRTSQLNHDTHKVNLHME